MELVEFKGKQLDKRVHDIMTEMHKQIENLEFDYNNSKWSDGSRTIHSDGGTQVYFERLDVYDSEDLKTPIGVIGMDGDQYFVVSPNITTGRRWWGNVRGEIKKSKHLKNVVKIAKDSIKPLDFIQAMQESSDSFRREIQSFGWDKTRVIQQATGGCLNIVQDDMLALFQSGYKPKSPAFKNIMEYINNNQEFIKKYAVYDPKFVGVWIKSNGVQLKYKNENNIVQFNDKENLPEEILSKICVMDICEPKKFDEALGYKFSDNHYWVML